MIEAVQNRPEANDTIVSKEGSYSEIALNISLESLDSLWPSHSV